MSNAIRSERWFCRVARSLILGCMVLLSAGSQTGAQEPAWSEPEPISPDGSWSWFPDLGVDVYGSPHVTWCWTEPLDKGGLKEQVLYATRHDGTWGEPNDIVPPSADIERNAIATDQEGNIHLLFGGSAYGTFTLRYQRASGDKAWSAAEWSMPHLMNQGLGYMGDIAVDSKGIIHIIYDDTRQNLLTDQRTLADMYYRRSTDGGRTWSPPHLLHNAPLTGSARPYIKTDNSDVVYVTWDEGWDRLAGTMADELYSVYLSSSDGGLTWTEPKLVEYPDATVVQLTAGSDGKDGVMLVWRSMARDRIYYQWSSDGGETWQTPRAIPQILARPWSNPFDMYDMATDSDGHIHLLVVGRQSPEEQALQEVYHLTWDGTQWSAPTVVFSRQNLYPQYPKIIVHEGDQLHAVWFTWEGSVWEQDVVRTVWYSQRQISAPHLPLTPVSTPTPESVQVSVSGSSSEPAATSHPQLDVEGSGLPDGLYTDSDEWLQLAIVLSPVVLVIVVLVALRMRWFNRS